jgi:DNA-binding CsgD family transcriptional regulator
MAPCTGEPGGTPLLKIVMVVFLLLWGLGLVTGHTLGGFLHALLVLALLLWLISLVRGNTP